MGVSVVPKGRAGSQELFNGIFPITRQRQGMKWTWQRSTLWPAAIEIGCGKFLRQKNFVAVFFGFTMFYFRLAHPAATSTQE